MNDSTQTTDDRTTDRRKGERESIAEILYGFPVLPLDAFAFGRRMGRRIKQLFPNKVIHVVRGLRTGIEEVSEREATRERAGGQST